jgi:hypothetical protein
VFKKVVALAQTILGAGINEIPPSSGWSTKDINVDDPIEVALASDLQNSPLAHVAASTSHAYVGPWNAFVIWCRNLLKPRRPLPADDTTVALYLQSFMNSANSFSAIKSASASIPFFHKINLFINQPIMAPKVCMVRTVAGRNQGCRLKELRNLLFGRISSTLLFSMASTAKVITT